MRHGVVLTKSGLISILLLAMNGKILDAIECFDCTNFPSQISCTASAECEGVGCYFVLNNNSTFWVASCSNSISITDRQTSCYKIPDGDEYCVCFKDFCNTPAEIEKAVDLRHTPFTSDPVMPWKDPTTKDPHTTLPTHPTILVNTIPTTLLLGKPADADDGPGDELSATIEADDQSGGMMPTSSMTTVDTPITSTEPRVHYANHSVLINDSSEAANKKLADASSASNANQTSIDDELGTVTEPNMCPSLIQNLHVNIYAFMIFVHALCRPLYIFTSSCSYN